MAAWLYRGVTVLKRRGYSFLFVMIFFILVSAVLVTITNGVKTQQQITSGLQYGLTNMYAKRSLVSLGYKMIQAGDLTEHITLGDMQYDATVLVQSHDYITDYSYWIIEGTWKYGNLTGTFQMQYVGSSNNPYCVSVKVKD